VKVLIDSCVAGSVAATLAEVGHEVECVADWPADPGDAAVLAHAHHAGQVLLTLDKDFGELAVVRRQAHAGIVRLVGLSTAQQAPVAAAALSRYAEELGRGALVTAEPERTRIRPGEL
jgi:predicted nuclease of predicted toxin-antitoxin system